MPSVIDKLGRKYGLMLAADEADFLHCCMSCEVASALGSVEACPQRVHTANSCCPSCDFFLEHGSEAMIAHWEDPSQIFVAFQIAIPLKVTEEEIRSAFGLQKVPPNQLRLLYEWQNTRALDVEFEKHVEWSMSIRYTYWPLDLAEGFLRDPLIYGLAGFPDRAGAAAFSQLRQIFEDFKEWIAIAYNIDPESLFHDEAESQSFASYFISYFLRLEIAENLTINILAPDYERSSDPESCLVVVGDSQIPLISFNQINEALIMQKGLLTSWQRIEPALENMLEELTDITAEMRTAQADSTVVLLTELLDRIQTIQEQFLKLKPSISIMQGHISPIVPLLSEPLVKKLLPNFNLSLVNSWLDYAKSVERSVDGANSYIQGKMNLLALNQERKTTKRINLLTALFGSLSGLNLILAYLTWVTPEPSQEA
ncbi:MAG: hypothetical protein ACFFB3_16005, partial [Candidatus Hodarchaeota archaeon]